MNSWTGIPNAVVGEFSNIHDSIADKSKEHFHAGDTGAQLAIH